MAMIVLFSRKAGRPLLAGFPLLLSLGATGCGGGSGDLSGAVSYQGKPLASGSILLIDADGKPRTARIQEDGSYHFAGVPVGEAKLAVYNSPDPAKVDEFRKREELRMKALREKSRVKRGILQEDTPTEAVAPALPTVDRTKWFAIPAEYGDLERSGLRVTIHGGTNTYPIEMK
jgi:hypothetical protein